ncbi:MAG: CoA-binding protein [Bdellovibrionota bacterium]
MIQNQNQNVAILGASDDPERYSYKACRKLEEHGHKVYLVNPKYDSIEGKKVYPSLESIADPIDTLTLYVGPKVSSMHQQSIKALHPKRVIFNPGAENAELEVFLQQENIETLQACTLVLLATDQF